MRKNDQVNVDLPKIFIKKLLARKGLEEPLAEAIVELCSDNAILTQVLFDVFEEPAFEVGDLVYSKSRYYESEKSEHVEYGLCVIKEVHPYNLNSRYYLEQVERVDIEGNESKQRKVYCAEDCLSIADSLAMP
jgi:hypothetical protein